jgi:hypothetical protein
MSELTIYQEQGFDNRRDYLDHLSEELEVDKDIVYELASVLGKSEDFDGLVTSLQDYA